MQEYMTEMKTHAWAHTDVHGTLRRSDRNIWRTRTSQMTPRELARVVADWHGWTVRNGYIYADKPYLKMGRSFDYTRKQGDAIAHGYNLLALVLHRLGIIEVGVGIHWRKQWEVAGSKDPIEIRSGVANAVWMDRAGKRRKCNG